jgi:ectoine hydroxylase-related dioxygenase (phytanoyl-CoA dioxygenase family)
MQESSGDGAGILLTNEDVSYYKVTPANQIKEKNRMDRIEKKSENEININTTTTQCCGSFHQSPKKGIIMSGVDDNIATSIEDTFKINGFVGPIDVLTQEEAHAALLEVVIELNIDGIDFYNKQKKAYYCCESSKLSSTNNNNSSNNTCNNVYHINVSNDRSRFKLHLILPTLDKIAHHPKIISMVRECLGNSNNLLLWSSDINIKPPNSKGYFAPHQDSTYAGLYPSSKCCTIWIALSDPVGVKEGCLSFYPQSISTMKQLPHHINENNESLSKSRIKNEEEESISSDGNNSNNNNNNMLSMGQYISKETLDNAVGTDITPISIPLRSGQMTIHAFNNVHYSSPNQSNSNRIGFALRYIDGNFVTRSNKSAVVKEMVTPIDIINYRSSTTTATPTCSNRIQNSTNTNANFDYEPRLPQTNLTNDDIQRMRIIRDEAMIREDTNYFSS